MSLLVDPVKENKVKILDIEKYEVNNSAFKIYRIPLDLIREEKE